MHFELLEKLTPDHYIKPTTNWYVMSTNDTLFKQLNTTANKQYSEAFITGISDFISDPLRQYALLLLNGCCFDNPDLKRFFLFIVRKVQQNGEVGLELYNISRLGDSVNGLFASDFWRNFKQIVKENIQTSGLSLAYESLLSFFILTNLDEDNIKLGSSNAKIMNLIFENNLIANTLIILL